jgi:hypothetical protein
MGWSCALYVLQAKNYHTLLRPILRELYGTTNTQFIIETEKNMMEMADLLKTFGQNYQAERKKNYNSDGKTPIMRYFQAHKTPEFCGRSSV